MHGLRLRSAIRCSRYRGGAPGGEKLTLGAPLGMAGTGPKRSFTRASKASCRLRKFGIEANAQRVNKPAIAIEISRHIHNYSLKGISLDHNETCEVSEPVDMSELRGKIVEVRPSLDTDASKKIGQSLKAIRKLSGLNQAQMAKRLDVSQASVSKVESGRGDVQFSTIQRFVEAVGGVVRVTAAFPANSSLSLHMRDAFEVELDHEDQLVFPIFADSSFRPQRDIVLSIRPQYANRIMAGEKTVELRRRFPASAPKGTIAYIYSTSPERAMVGLAEIAGVRKLAVEDIWRQYADVAYIERADFDSYFKGVDQGFALEFENVHPFEMPLSLADLRERFGFEPPQSFLYVKRDLRRALKDEHTIVSN
jgi:predicted transcriptional regulator/DNA-binding XRE family transcriptional regulator